MNLSAEMFMEIVSRLTGDPAQAKGAERRKSPRVGVRARIEIEQAVMGDKGVQRAVVQMREISPTGVSFLLARKMTKGDHFTANFEKNDGGVLTVEYEVRHCTQLAQNSYLVGAQLKAVNELASTSPQALMRKLAS